jgi:GNAT superfamily N-acetyltransferase
MSETDINRIADGFIEQGDNKPRRIFEKYYHEQKSGDRVVVIAETDGEIAGYVTLLPKAKDAVPFLKQGFPEIKDLNVLKKYQEQGIGSALMNRIEDIAATYADTVCLSVGLHSGYGTAQRMYVKRGYIPDGTGVWNGGVPAEPYGMVNNDDDLLLHMSKKFS